MLVPLPLRMIVIAMMTIVGHLWIHLRLLLPANPTNHLSQPANLSPPCFMASNSTHTPNPTHCIHTQTDSPFLPHIHHLGIALTDHFFNLTNPERNNAMRKNIIQVDVEIVSIWKLSQAQIWGLISLLLHMPMDGFVIDVKYMDTLFCGACGSATVTSISHSSTFCYTMIANIIDIEQIQTSSH